MVYCNYYTINFTGIQGKPAKNQRTDRFMEKKKYDVVIADVEMAIISDEREDL